jgi:hypothetical protein
MSKDLEVENEALKSKCNMYEQFIEKCRYELAEQNRQLAKWQHFAEESSSKLTEAQAKIQEMNYTINELHELTKLSLDVARLENEEAGELEQKFLKGVNTANEKKSLKRKTTESYISHYKLLVEKHIDNGKNERRAKELARNEVADLVEKKVGDRPSDQLLYKIFPVKNSLTAVGEK